MINSKLCAIGFVALTLTTIPAIAQEEQTLSQTVNVADLDLSTKAGMKQLHFRIAGAIYDVCGDDRVRLPLRESTMIESCIRQAKAMSEVQIAALTSKRIQTASSR